MTENDQQSHDENSKDLQPVEDKSLTTLTDQNWLFVNAYLKLGNIRKAYEIAGYRSKDKSAPYQLFKHLKTKIEDIGNLDIASRARLLADCNKALGIPLEEKEELKFSEWLRLRKFMASITPEVQQAQPKLSMLVINRYDKREDVSKKVNVSPSCPGHNTQAQDIDKKDVIDIEPEP